MSIYVNIGSIKAVSNYELPCDPLELNRLASWHPLTTLKKQKVTVRTNAFVWTDERMTWNPADYKGLNGITRSDMIWKPMIIFTSAFGEIVPIRNDAHWMPVNGLAPWSSGESISSNCPMNIK
ncbi:hypothetical protein MAR_002257, partial [Mya arenaria]